MAYQQKKDNNSIFITSDLLTIGEAIGNHPVNIVIPSLKIDLPVRPSRVINGLWEIHDDSANFGIGSALPGESGNSVIFAHAREGLFYPLRNIQKDDSISVQTKDGIWFSYKVSEKKEVDPNQVEVIAPTTDSTLTLYTCTGFSDSKRLVVVAKAINK